MSQKLTAILSREAELKNKLADFSDEKFYAARDAALSKARKGNASPEDLEEAAAAVDGRLVASFHGLREAISLSLEAHRIESFPVFRDEFIVQALEDRKARREQLQKDVSNLNLHYPGANVRFDATFDEGAIQQLQAFAWSDNGNGFTDMGSIVSYYA
jgi:hypothetical protein